METGYAMVVQLLIKRLFKRKPKIAIVKTVDIGEADYVKCPYCGANMIGVYKEISMMCCWNCGKVMELKRENAGIIP